MKRRGWGKILVISVIASTLIINSSEARIRIPGDQIFSLVSIVFGAKMRRDTYRAADRILNNQIANAELEQQKLQVMAQKGWISQRKYSLSSTYLASQQTRYERLHQLIKSDAHHEFEKMFKQELMAHVLHRLGQSKSFVRQANRFGGLLEDAVSHMDGGINALNQAKKWFWPDRLRDAHEKIKKAREMIGKLRTVGITTGDLERTLRRLDQKLEKLKKKTDPKTLNAALGSLKEDRKATDDLRKEVSSAVEKFKKVKAETIRVTRWISKDPEIQRLISEIGAYDELIKEPEIRWAMGEEMYHRSRDLGLNPYGQDFGKVRKEYLAQLVAHLKRSPAKRLTPDLLDRLLIAAVKEATGKDVKFAEVRAVIQGKISTGEAPLRIELDGSSSRPKEALIDYEWRIISAKLKDGGELSSKGPWGGPLFSFNFEKPGEYTIQLEITDRRGVKDKSSKVISVTPKYTAEVTVSLAIKPPKVKPGEEVTFIAKPKGTKEIEDASVVLIFKVDGKEYKRDNFGEMGYGNAWTVTYTVPEDAEGRDYPVSVQAIATLPEKLQKAMKKETVSSEEVGDSFFVDTEKSGDKDLFIGKWEVNLRLIDASDKNKLKEIGGKTIGPAPMEIGRDNNGYTISREIINYIDSIEMVGSELVVKGRNVEKIDYYDEHSGRTTKRDKTNKHKMVLRVSEDGKYINGTIESDIDVFYRENDHEVLRIFGQRNN
jgi:hypothetical protein